MNARRQAAATRSITSSGNLMASPDADVLVPVLEDMTDPDKVAQLLVGTPSRDVFSPEVLLLLLMRVPERCRLECARAVVTALVCKAERTQIEATRSRCFSSVGAAVRRFCVQPALLPARAMTPYQFADVAVLWGMRSPCGCRVVRRSALPAALEFVRFREWHTHTYCDVPGPQPDVHWRDISSVLVRHYALHMVQLAVRAAGHEMFPAELQLHIARFLVRP